jgi:hypothetical protein
MLSGPRRYRDAAGRILFSRTLGVPVEPSGGVAFVYDATISWQPTSVSLHLLA